MVRPTIRILMVDVIVWWTFLPHTWIHWCPHAETRPCYKNIDGRYHVRSLRLLLVSRCEKQTVTGSSHLSFIPQGISSVTKAECFNYKLTSWDCISIFQHRDLFSTIIQLFTSQCTRSKMHSWYTTQHRKVPKNASRFAKYSWCNVLTHIHPTS